VKSTRYGFITENDLVSEDRERRYFSNLKIGENGADSDNEDSRSSNSRHLDFKKERKVARKFWAQKLKE
jgi:hypothetical protein